jgi:hypothetical protein
MISRTNTSKILARVSPAALLAVALLAIGLVPAKVSAQTPLPVAQAAEFLGKWNVSIESEMGPFEVSLNIQDSEGKTVATVGSPQGGDVAVTDISRTGEQLVLKYSFAGPDGDIPILVNLIRDGENLKTTMDVGGGLFSATGTGRRATQ